MPKMKIENSFISNEIAKDGTFHPQTTSFNTKFGTQQNELPIMANRYRLIVVEGCPFAQRTLITLKLLGLDNVISVGKASSIRSERGWEFSNHSDNLDPILNIRFLEEAYLKADPNYQKRPTVPALIDIETGKVVNNNHHTIMYELETSWANFHKINAPNLFPVELQTEIRKLNEILYVDVNHGVFSCGYAASQEVYEQNYYRLFNRLDWLEDRLKNRRFLFGDFITDADIRLFVTLVRFDIVFYPLFKCNRNRLVDFKNLWRYAKDLYQIPEFRETTSFEDIKTFAYVSPHYSVQFNPTKIFPVGPDLSIWEV